MLTSQKKSFLVSYASEYVYEILEAAELEPKTVLMPIRTFFLVWQAPLGVLRLLSVPDTTTELEVLVVLAPIAKLLSASHSIANKTLSHDQKLYPVLLKSVFGPLEIMTEVDGGKTFCCRHLSGGWLSRANP
jgi:hypothetical protein